MKKRSEKYCQNCNHKASYSYEYDAYYCEHCNTWLEKECDDGDCEFCKDRPEKPREVTNDSD